MKTTMGIKLDEETRERLKALGQIKDRSPHWLMKTAIQEYLDKEENYVQEKQEDLQRWSQYAETGKFITQTDMTSWLDSLAENAAQKENP